MLTFKVSGNYNKTKKFLHKSKKVRLDSILNKYGRKGVEVLSDATPKDTGLTASSWSYSISHTPNGATVSWKNSNVNNGVPIAIILQYGHGTRNGGYVQGKDYINPAMRPVFDELAKAAWKEVSSS